MNAPSPVELLASPQCTGFGASIVRPALDRPQDPMDARQTQPRLQKPLSISGIVRIAAGFIAGAFDLTDEIARRIAHTVDAPVCRPQSIGPVR